MAVLAASPAGETAFVTKVIDGDTLDVERNGRTERVRLLGIDAPELPHDGAPGEPFAREATAFARSLARGRRVTLLAEPGHEDQDRYGRLLRYVILPDGRCLNVLLVCEGYARLFARERLARGDELRACDKAARAAGRGLWSQPQ
jgi:micrococcal nuclease